MRVIPAKSLEQSPESFAEVIQVLREGGLVCYPGHRQYSIAASLLSEDAVMRLVQAKHRSGRAPSLVLIPNREALLDVVEEIPEKAIPLMDAFWPGPLTLLLKPNENLPSKVIKLIKSKKPGKIGVRIPAPGLTLRMVQEFGGPLLTSSANLSKKTGSSSVSYVRKEFSHTVDLLLDAGDLSSGEPSTLIDLDEVNSITREGRIKASDIAGVLEPGKQG